jgi:hypothetical protein
MPDDETIVQQQELLQAHRNTLAHLLRQEAHFELGHVPAHLAHGIANARAGIQDAKHALRDWGLDAEDYPNDIALDLVPETSTASKSI